jgi:hypothetical protein
MLFGPDMPTKELRTETCFHCNTVIHVDLVDKLFVCRRCMGFVCGPCRNKWECVPFEKQLDEIEKKDRALRSRGY